MSTTEGRPHRRFRVNMRELMALVFLISVPLGWLVGQAHTQRDAVAAIRKARGHVRYIYQYNDSGDFIDGTLSLPQWLLSKAGADYFDTVVSVKCRPSIIDADLAPVGRLAGLESLDLGGAASITDAGLEHLKGLRRLKHLGLSGTAVTNRGLVHLRGMTSLQSLQLAGTRVDGAGMEHLRGLTDLDWLNLDGTQVDDAGLEHLEGLTSLSALSLQNTRVDGSGLEHLKGLTRLRTLHLGGTRIDDAGLERLRGLIGLETLELGATRITDAGLAILGRSPSLLHIDTGGTEAVDDARITDAGAVHLAGLPHLWSLRLAHARWTDAGVSAIRKSTPRIVVYQAPSR